MYKFEDKISVVIPVYNRDYIIDKALETTFNQTYDNIEVIVVDTGSTDNTEKIMKNIKDDRLIYFRIKERKSVCWARNYGIKKATGKYVTFQDSDNFLYKDKLEKQYNNLIKNNSDMDFCKVLIKISSENIEFPSKEQVKNMKKTSIIEELCKSNLIDTNAIFIKSNVIKKELFDETIDSCEDYDLALSITSKYNVSFTNRILVDNTIQDDSRSNTNKNTKNAIKIMLQKDYKLNPNLKNILNNYLIDFMEWDLLKPFNKEYSKISNEYNKVLKKYRELEKMYFDLLDKYNEINK